MKTSSRTLIPSTLPPRLTWLLIYGHLEPALFYPCTPNSTDGSSLSLFFFFFFPFSFFSLLFSIIAHGLKVTCTWLAIGSHIVMPLFGSRLDCELLLHSLKSFISSIICVASGRNFYSYMCYACRALHTRCTRENGNHGDGRFCELVATVHVVGHI